jgi:hypothetical protein
MFERSKNAAGNYYSIMKIEKITNRKFQNSNKSQLPKFKIRNATFPEIYLFGHWNLGF